MTLIKKLALTIVLLNVLIFLLINLIYTERGKELFEQVNVLIQSIILMASFQVLFQQNISSVFVYSCLGLIMVAMVRTVYLIHKETILS